MLNTHLLDSNRLINIKQRHGISIRSGSSTSVYLLSRKIKNKLNEKLKSYFKYEMDLDIHVDRLISKFNDIDMCTVFAEYVEKTDSETLFKETSKLRPFISKMKKILLETKAANKKNNLIEDIEGDDDFEEWIEEE